MTEEREALVANFSEFASSFEETGWDWRVAVTSTDGDGPHAGILRRYEGKPYIDASVPDVDAAFAALLDDDLSGQANEQGIRAAYLALGPKAGGQNHGFLRNDAYLGVVAISDEDDQSLEPTRGEFVSFLSGLKSSTDMVEYYAIVGDAPSGCTGDGGEATAGRRYHSVTDALEGESYSICDADWSPIMSDLGITLSAADQEYFLSQEPVPSSLKVLVYFEHDPDRHPGEMTVYEFFQASDDSRFKFEYVPERNSIILPFYLPPRDAHIDIFYDLLAQVAPQGNDIEVP